MTRPPVTISPLQHRGARRIKVECPFDPAVISQIKKVKGRQWSKTHHCWHVPYTTEAFRQLKEMFDVSISPESGVRKQTPHTVKSGLDTTSETILLEKESKYRMKAFVPWQRKDWIDRIKTIPGRAWNEEEKYWSLPLARAVVEDLKTWFGKQLELKFEVPKYLPGNYLPKNWKTTANRVDKENHSTAWPHIAVSQKATHLKTPVPTKHAPVKQRIPAASLNKLNIQPGATPQLQTFMQDGMELIRVMGDSIIICPSGAHFVEAYLPLNKPGWIKDIREIPGRTWSPEAKCWRLPYVVETIKLLYRAFGGKAVFSFRPSDEIPVEWADKKPPGTTSPEPLLPVHKECLIALEKQLMLERKSRSTIRSYKHHLRRFLQHYPGTPPADINEKQIKDYLLYLVNEKSIAESTQNLVINSIKAFYEKVLKQEQKMYYIPRPKKRQTLPGIFSEKEVVNLLDATGNPKHKCILMVIYSAGLRLGELVNLKTR
ncbi:MAG: tyrosine-type recombinase/integrase, partial [Saprospiraceae bacterium]